MKIVNSVSVLAACVIITALSLAGCGGGDGGNDGGAAPPVVTTIKSTFLVKDTSGAAVAGATVYAIPATDVAALATQPITLNMTDGQFTADALKVDEPLEDLINGNYTPTGGGVATYKHAVTDATGTAVLTDLPVGAADMYFMYVKPADTDTGHLPGGSLTRVAQAGSSLVGKETAVKVSTMPSAAATYIGSSLCIVCHTSYATQKQTLHRLGIMVPNSPSALQDLTRFSSTTDPDQDFKAGLKTFEGAGTTLYYYGYSGGTAGTFKVKTTDPRIADPTQVVKFTLHLGKSAAGVYQVTFANLVNPTDPLAITRDVSLSYGGGEHKQRYLTKIGKSNYVIPTQFNPQGSDASPDAGRYQYVEYDPISKKWWDPTTSMFIDPNTDDHGGKYKSFDSFCAGCHYTGFSLTKNADDTYTATATSDYQGEVHPQSGTKQEMNIGCETCHGPGSEHMAAGGEGKFIITPANLTPEREVQICASCHTRTDAKDKDGHGFENPLDANNKMPRPGISRADFLANHVKKQDNSAYWADGQHVKKHHEQVQDFVQSNKYRNGSKLMACSNCHDVHAPGPDTVRHQLRSSYSDNTLCLSCHATEITDIVTHMMAKTGFNMGAGTSCVDCHMPKTAKSGSGSPFTKFVGLSGKSYYQNDIASHRFDVPMKTAVSATNQMPIAYTNACGACHQPGNLP